MRVLLAHPSAELYGSDRMALVAVRALVQRGHSVTVVAPADGPLLDHIRQCQATAVIADIPVLRKSDLRSTALIKLAWRVAVAQRCIGRLIRSADPDVVYVNTIVQPWWILGARLRRRRIVAHVREAEEQLPLALAKLINAPLLLTDAVLCNSRATKRAIDSAVPSLRTRTRVLYNGKDWSDYHFARESPAPRHPDRPLRLTVVGRLSPRKGQDLAVRALGEIVAAGIDATLMIVGDTFPGYEWYEHDLLQLAGDLGLTERVRFTGFQTDIRPILAGTDIAIVPSRIEPFGTVAAECMAAGLPTIVADVQGLSEIVEDGCNGWTFAPDDSGDLAQRCLWAIRHPDESTKIAARAHGDVLERFSLEQYEAGVVATLESVERVNV